MVALHLEVLAGFANRLRSLISGICFAEDLQIPLVIYWKSRDPACAIRFEKIFDLKSLPPFVRVVDGTLAYSDECLSVEEKDRLVGVWDKKKNLYWRSYGIFYRPNMEKWLRALRSFKPASEILMKVNERLPPFDSEHLIGVHIRRGDNLKSIQGSPIDAFIKRMGELDGFFVIATDDEKTKNILQMYFKDITFPSTIRKRNTEEGMIDGVVDFFCLARCPKILGSAFSSFSEIASLYGGSRLEIVMAT